MFTDEESAENGLVVFGIEGYLKAKNDDDIRKLYTGEEVEEGIVVLEEYQKLSIDEILANDKGIPGFFPVNSSLFSTEELIPYKGGLDHLKKIKKVIIKEGGERKEFAMSDDNVINGEWNFPGSDTMMA